MGDQSNITSAVLVPLSQAAITGGLTGFSVGCVAWLLAAESPATIGFTAGVVITSLSWLALRSGWEKRLSAILGIEAAPAEAETYSQLVHVEIVSEAGLQGDYLDLPGGEEKLIRLAKGLSEGKPFTVRFWTGKAGLYSGPDFERLRAELIARGLARWRSEHDTKQGCDLTAKGKAVMRGLAKRGK